MGFGKQNMFHNMKSPVVQDSFTKLLLHCDDVAWTDSSQNNRIATVVGGMTISSTHSKFGPYGGRTITPNTTGTGSKVTFADSADWILATQSFTIDCWVYFSSEDALHSMSIWQGNAWLLYFQPGEFGMVSYSSQSPTLGCYAYSTPTVSLDVWHHVALGRNGIGTGNWFWFIDGVPQFNNWAGAIGSGGATWSFPNTADVLSVGTDTYAYGPEGNGKAYFDEVRISVGTCRWTGTFTPPPGPY